MGQREDLKNGMKETVEKENCKRFYANPIESSFNGLRVGVAGGNLYVLWSQVTKSINNLQ